MSKQNLLFSIIGIVIGFAGGFFLANSINRNAALQQPVALQNMTGAAPTNPQTPSVSIKDSTGSGGGMNPEVAQILSQAQNQTDNFEAQIKAGEMYVKIQNAEKANEFFARAANAHRNTFQDLTTLGNAFFDVKNFEEAAKWYELALAKNPNDVDVRTDLGSTFMERPQPDLDRAIKEYQTSLEKNPQHESTIFNLSLALMRKGNLQDAQEMLIRLEKLNPASPLAQKLKERLLQMTVK